MATPKEYQDARALLNSLPVPEPTYVFFRGEWVPFTVSKPRHRESCWTDEEGVQHWTVEYEDGKTQEFTR